MIRFLQLLQTNVYVPTGGSAGGDFHSHPAHGEGSLYAMTAFLCYLIDLSILPLISYYTTKAINKNQRDIPVSVILIPIAAGIILSYFFWPQVREMVLYESDYFYLVIIGAFILFFIFLELDRVI